MKLLQDILQQLKYINKHSNKTTFHCYDNW